MAEDLKADIRERPDPRTAKLAALEAAIAKFDARPSMSQTMLQLLKVDTKPRGGPITPNGFRPGSRREQFHNMAVAMMDATKDGEVHRRTLIEKAMELGIIEKIDGRDRKAVEREAAKFLTVNKALEAVGNGYWRRKPEAAKEQR